MRSKKNIIIRTMSHFSNVLLVMPSGGVGEMSRVKLEKGSPNCEKHALQDIVTVKINL